MYGCESWTIKKAEHQRSDSFVQWCWRRLLWVPWTEKRLNQSILKDFNPEYYFQRLMLKLKLQYFGHLMRRTDSLEKTLMLERIEGRKRRGQSRMRWLNGITNLMYMNLSNLQELAWCSPCGCKALDTTEWLNWTLIIYNFYYLLIYELSYISLLCINKKEYVSKINHPRYLNIFFTLNLFLITLTQRHKYLSFSIKCHSLYNTRWLWE